MKDSGLQPERTALAWSRTAIGIAVNALLILRGGLLAQEAAVVLLGGALGVFAAGVAIATRRRHDELSQAIEKRPPLLLLRFVSVVTVMAACASVWLALG